MRVLACVALAMSARVELEFDGAPTVAVVDEAMDLERLAGDVVASRDGWMGAGCEDGDRACFRAVLAGVFREALADALPAEAGACGFERAGPPPFAPRAPELVARAARGAAPGEAARVVVAGVADAEDAGLAAAWAASVARRGATPLVVAAAEGSLGAAPWAAVHAAGARGVARALVAAGVDVVVGSPRAPLLADPFASELAKDGCAAAWDAAAGAASPTFLRGGSAFALTFAAAWDAAAPTCGAAAARDYAAAEAAALHGSAAPACRPERLVASRRVLLDRGGLGGAAGFVAVEVTGDDAATRLARARDAAAFGDAAPRPRVDGRSGPWLLYLLEGPGQRRWERAWLEALLGGARSAVAVVPRAPADPVAALWEALARPERVIVLVNCHDVAVLESLAAGASAFYAACARKHVGLVVVDEGHGGWFHLNPQLVDHAKFALLLGFGRFVDPDAVPGLRRRPRVLQAPLGPAAADALREARKVPILERRFGWGYLGRLQGPARAHMLAAWLAASDARAAAGGDAAGYVLHVTAGVDEQRARAWRRGMAWDVPTNASSWRRGLERALPPGRYRAALGSVVFAPSPPARNSNLRPDFNVRKGRHRFFGRASRTRRERSIRPKISRIDCGRARACQSLVGASRTGGRRPRRSPPGNVHPECYRTYEALEAGAIPVVSSHYYAVWFGAPFPVVDADWSDESLAKVFALLDRPDELRALADACAAWWAAAKADFPRRAAALLDAVDGVAAEEAADDGGDAPCDGGRRLYFAINYNGFDYETTFPAVADDATLRREALALMARLDLRFGQGCDDAECVADEIVADMRRRVDEACGAPAPAPAPARDWVFNVLDVADGGPAASGAPARVAAPPGGGGDLVAALARGGAAPVSHFPFEASTGTPPPRRGGPVLVVVRNPFESYCAWGGRAGLSLLQYAHRWVAHHEYWAARADLPRVRVSYENLLAGDLTPAAAAALVDGAGARARALAAAEHADDACGARFDRGDLAAIHRDLGPSLAALGFEIAAAPPGFRAPGG